jgi:hypothetical protein
MPTPLSGNPQPKERHFLSGMNAGVSVSENR